MIDDISAADAGGTPTAAPASTTTSPCRCRCRPTATLDRRDVIETATVVIVGALQGPHTRP